MAKYKVYELARELNMKNRELLARLKEMNISARSHMSGLDRETVAYVKANLSSEMNIKKYQNNKFHCF